MNVQIIPELNPFKAPFLRTFDSYSDDQETVEKDDDSTAIIIIFDVVTNIKQIVTLVTY